MLSYSTYEGKWAAYHDNVDIDVKELIETLAKATRTVKTISTKHEAALAQLAKIEKERTWLERERNELIEVRNTLRQRVVKVIQTIHENGGRDVAQVTKELIEIHAEETRQQEMWFRSEMEKSRTLLQTQLRIRLEAVAEAQRRALAELTHLSLDESAFRLEEVTTYTSKVDFSSYTSKSSSKSISITKST